MVRRSISEDRDAIEKLLDAAFAPSLYESKLYHCVARSGEAFHDWVYESDGIIVAYVLFTQATRNGNMIGWHLAPIAVAPPFQNQGIGSGLISHSLGEEPLDESAVFVLGDPAYYERFGFNAVDSARCPYDSGNTHFRAVRWAELSERFTIGYSKAFNDAELKIENGSD